MTQKIKGGASAALVTFATIALITSAQVFAKDNGDNRGKSDEHKPEMKMEMKQHMQGFDKIRGMNEERMKPAVYILPNQDVLVRGAEVTAVGSSSISAEVNWGSLSMAWKVNVASSTKFIFHDDGPGSLSDVKVGDTISFKGKLVSTESQFTVDAQVVKDWSLLKSPKVFEGGILQSLASTTPPTTMVVRFHDSDFTVRIATSTAILDAAWRRVSLSAFDVGDQIRVFGPMSASSTIDATVVRDVSL